MPCRCRAATPSPHKASRAVSASSGGSGMGGVEDGTRLSRRQLWLEELEQELKQQRQALAQGGAA